MRALQSPQGHQLALVWSLSLLILAGVGLITWLDPSTRQQAATVIGALAQSPADYKVTEPTPALHSNAPLRTH